MNVLFCFRLGNGLLIAQIPVFHLCFLGMDGRWILSLQLAHWCEWFLVQSLMDLSYYIIQILMFVLVINDIGLLIVSS